MAKSKLPRIKVETLPNGYSLEFQGQKLKHGYMYFTPEQLVVGIFYHIGLGAKTELPKELRDELTEILLEKKNEMFSNFKKEQRNERTGF